MIEFQYLKRGGEFMPIDVMVKEATGLPDKYVDMVVSYIHFLQYQVKYEEDKVHLSGKRELGLLADRFHFIADDFDDTPDCFEDYI